MRHAYSLPTDEAVLWPRVEEVCGHNRLHLGRRILDSGLQVCWGDGQHWIEGNEQTSPRGRVWQLRSVCWLSVQATVLAPPPGCYAAFIRARQTAQRPPLLGFSAEWKVAATTAVCLTEDDVGFLKRTDSRRPPPALRQEGEASASWTHCQEYDEDNPGGWLLLHVGNVVVREASEAQKRAAATDGGAGSTNPRGPAVSGGGPAQGRHVAISFGGDNPRWARNLEVDFAAIVPFRLSWDIERVLMIGNRKGHLRQSFDRAAHEHEREECEELDRVVEAAPFSVGSHNGCSPLSCLPSGVMVLVLDFAQPTLVRPRGSGQAREVAEDVQADGEHWKVF